MSDSVIPELRMYGYCVAWRKSVTPEEHDPAFLPAWKIEQCDEYLNLPAHYPSLDEALDRAAFLRSKGVHARVVALVAEPTDKASDFERYRANRPE